MPTEYWILLSSVVLGVLPVSLAIAILYCRYNKNKQAEESGDVTPSPSTEYHCISCLCKNPALVEILSQQGTYNVSLTSGFEEEGQFGSSLAAQKDFLDFTSIQENSRRQINNPMRHAGRYFASKGMADFVSPLTPEYLEQCRDPTFLERELERIESQFQHEREKLSGAKDDLLESYQSGYGTTSHASERTTETDDKFHCTGCLCGHPDYSTLLLQNENLFGLPKHDNRDDGDCHEEYRNINTMTSNNYVPTKFEEQGSFRSGLRGYNKYPTDVAASIGLPLTKEYLEKCRNPAFLNEQLKMIKAARQSERDKLKQERDTLLENQRRHTEVLIDHFS